MADDPACERDAEAARYALLRRIGPALRHDLVVDLQAVALMTEVLGARLDKGLLTQDALQAQVARIHRVVRDAVARSLSVAAWLAPPDEEGVDLAAGLDQCLRLVRNHLGFRGFTLAARPPDGAVVVSGDLLRHLLPATLIHLSDQAGHPGLLEVSAQVRADAAILTVTLQPAASQGPVQAEAPQPWRRPLASADLRALADAGGVPLQAQSGQVVLRLPRLVPLSPLQIAPR